MCRWRQIVDSLANLTIVSRPLRSNAAAPTANLAQTTRLGVSRRLATGGAINIISFPNNTEDVTDHLDSDWPKLTAASEPGRTCIIGAKTKAPKNKCVPLAVAEYHPAYSEQKLADACISNGNTSFNGKGSTAPPAYVRAPQLALNNIREAWATTPGTKGTEIAECTISRSPEVLGFIAVACNGENKRDVSRRKVVFVSWQLNKGSTAIDDLPITESPREKKRQKAVVQPARRPTSEIVANAAEPTPNCPGHSRQDSRWVLRLLKLCLNGQSNPASRADLPVLLLSSTCTESHSLSDTNRARVVGAFGFSTEERTIWSHAVPWQGNKARGGRWKCTYLIEKSGLTFQCFQGSDFRLIRARVYLPLIRAFPDIRFNKQLD
ncbi:hypothetical protein B0H11DRAFT_1921693 [Mycena galericulata]|nr:hypothetical protein B0H11DRAFT_1921693 [Mycena galericulata]